jgi:hypothetical protein
MPIGFNDGETNQTMGLNNRSLTHKSAKTSAARGRVL